MNVGDLKLSLLLDIKPFGESVKTAMNILASFGKTAKDAGKSSIIKIANKVTTIANIIFILPDIMNLNTSRVFFPLEQSFNALYAKAKPLNENNECKYSNSENYKCNSRFHIFLRRSHLAKKTARQNYVTDNW